MAIPSNPSIGQVYTNDITNVSYKWTGDRWISWYLTTLADLDSSFVTVSKSSMQNKIFKMSNMY